MSKRSRALTPLALTALALLEERPMHPYEMLQILRERGKQHILTIKAGSFYHTVARLARLDLAEVHGIERAGRRPERTVYTLTAEGHATIVRWVRVHLAAPSTPQEFSIALAEVHNLDIDEATQLLRKRLAELTRIRDSLAADLSRAVADDIPFAYLVEIDRRLALTEADVGWTTSTLDRLDTDPSAWPDIHLTDQPASTIPEYTS